MARPEARAAAHVSAGALPAPAHWASPASDEPRGFDALALHLAEGSNEIGSSVQLLADFALKLSLGPISRSWVPEVRRSVDALLLTGKQRNETALVALSTRLLDVLPGGSRRAEAHAEPEAAALDEPTGHSTAANAPATNAPATNAPATNAPPPDAVELEETRAPAVAGLDAPIQSADQPAAVAAEVGADAGSDADGAAVAVATAAVTPSLVAGPSSARAAAPETIADEPLGGALRESILHELSRLAGVLPEWPAPAQDLAEEARRREMQVMRELFSQVDGLKRDQRARLEQQMRLEELATLSPDAIADEFDAPIERASELRDLLDAYRLERQAREPDVGNAMGLSLALDDLDAACRAFDDCDPEQKDAVRVLRASRRQALGAVNLLLAERGELQWLEQLEPLAIGERVERLKQWLRERSERLC